MATTAVATKRPRPSDTPPAETIPPIPPPAAKPASGWTVPRVEVPIPDQFSPAAAHVLIPVNLPQADRFALRGNPGAVLQQALAGAALAFQENPDLVRHRQLADAAAAWRRRQAEAQSVAAERSARLDTLTFDDDGQLAVISRELADARLAASEAAERASRFEGQAAVAKGDAAAAWKTIYAAAVAASKAALDQQLVQRRQELADVLAQMVPGIIELQEAVFALDETRMVNPPAMPS